MDEPLLALAAMINGEAAGANFDTKVMVGSSAIQRMKSGRTQEFGSTLPEVLQKGYYAVQNQNEPYKQAITQKFPDKKAENAYKQSLAVASGLIKGTIEPKDVMFYFTNKEDARQHKKGTFNYKKVRSTGTQEGFNMYSY
jgi:aminopeptidase C